MARPERSTAEVEKQKDKRFVIRSRPPKLSLAAAVDWSKERGQLTETEGADKQTKPVEETLTSQERVERKQLQGAKITYFTHTTHNVMKFFHQNSKQVG